MSVRLLSAGLLLTLANAALGQPQFVDVTEDVGINFVGEGIVTAVTPIQRQFQRSMGNGAAVGDYDNDGDLDLYLVRGDGRPALLRNDQTDTGRRFRDVTVAAGVDRGGQLRVAHFADLDNDGWLDLVVIGDDDDDGPNGSRLYQNNGDGTFNGRTAQGDLRPLGQLHCGSSLADYDGDGLLDVYVTNWGLHATTGPSEFDGSNRLFRNLGDFRFADVTGPAGLGTVARDSFTAIFTDFDDDLRPDLFIAQDHTPDKYYRNIGGAFVDASAQVNVPHAGNDMGVAAADFDDDGDLDLFVTNITDAEGVFGTGQFNSFNVNIGTPDAPLFEDQAVARGVQDTYWGWGTQFTDVDHDGDLDLVAATGFDEFVEAVKPDSGILQSPTVLLLNDGSGHFTRRQNVGLEAGWDSRGLIAFDYDRDGDQDLLLTNIAQPVRLFENVGADGHWLSVALEQLPGRNRQGIGARVYATIGTRTLRRDVLAGDSYVSSGPAEVHFGLGQVGVIDQLRVLWTDGSETILTHVPADQHLTIRQVGLCDCDGDEVADGAQIRLNPALDADRNGVLDACQTAGWDCNGNGVPDGCEPDCNGNGVPDDCDRDPNDPDGDGVVLTDCDGDRLLDVCNLAAQAADCNGNGVLDRCEIAAGTAPDVDDNGVPDECELIAGCPTDEWLGNPNGDFAARIAYRADLAVVGQHAAGAGAAQVYRRTGGSWTLEATLHAPDGQPGDNFGISVATDGQRVLVGANNHDPGGASKAGAAYVFAYGTGGWQLDGKLIAANPVAFDFFGRAVALDGDRAAVGAPSTERRRVNGGSAYLFERVGGTWIQVDEVWPQSASPDDNFGTALALEGRHLLVGSHRRDLGLDLSDAGGAFFYLWTDGARTPGPAVTAPLPAGGDRFGWSLGISGDTAVIAASRSDTTAEDAGEVFVYEFTEGAGWLPSQRLQAPRPVAGAQFGGSVALWQDQLAVGAEKAGGPAGPGATWLFGRDTETWRVRAKWTGADSGARGSAVAIGPRFVLSGNAAGGTAVVLSTRQSDCNANGVTDTCDLADGLLTDADDDGQPDECCPGDFDGNGAIGLSDLAILLAAFAQPPDAQGQGDVDGDRDVDLNDLMLLLTRFGSSCSE